ncbi:DUF4242 domain-containing protein [Marinoscillum sp.]|uniref:DUF4242 domain-containing protein n=1 Tax=Marinoscillum sp. TaxID=2024838 RepID=UPI003BA9348C
MKTLKTCTIIVILFLVNVGYAQKKQPDNSIKMKTYLIKRDMPGAGKLSQEDLQGASKKSVDVLDEMNTDIKWINSYVVDNQLYCVYEAENKSLIKEHAKKGGFPCTEIMEIKANIGPATAVANKDEK